MQCIYILIEKKEDIEREEDNTNIQKRKVGIKREVRARYEGRCSFF